MPRNGIAALVQCINLADASHMRRQRTASASGSRPGAASPPLISLKRRMTIFGESRGRLHKQGLADVV